MIPIVPLYDLSYSRQVISARTRKVPPRVLFLGDRFEGRPKGI